MATRERYAAEDRRRYQNSLIALVTLNRAKAILRSLPREPDAVIEQRRFDLVAAVLAHAARNRRENARKNIPAHIPAGVP